MLPVKKREHATLKQGGTVRVRCFSFIQVQDTGKCVGCRSRNAGKFIDGHRWVAKVSR